MARVLAEELDRYDLLQSVLRQSAAGPRADSIIVRSVLNQGLSTRAIPMCFIICRDPTSDSREAPAFVSVDDLVGANKDDLRDGEIERLGGR